MSEESPNCPKCQASSTYHDGLQWVCGACFHEWSSEEIADESGEASASFKDANGVVLENGDTVALVKDLKVGKDTLKSGTKVKNIRLLDDPVDDHDISCKIPGFGSMYLKCSVVKKIK